MITSDEFRVQVADAFEHLYDFVYLRTLPLASVMVPDPLVPPKEKGWRLHQTLLAAIEELDPGPQAPTFSREWRRHQAMVLRFAQGLDPTAVAGQLAVSRRHYYRLQEAALAAIADILWQRFASTTAASPSVRKSTDESATASELELVRLEVARLARAERYSRIGDVLQGVLSLLQDQLEQCHLEVRLSLPPTLPGVPVGQNVLRQILLGVFGYLMGHAERATLGLGALAEGTMVRLSVRLEPATAARPGLASEVQEHLAAFEEMAASSGVQILTVYAAQKVVGFDVELPVAERAILVVDDSEDTLSLVQRYLGPHHYRVLTACTAQEALDKARQARPFAIALDLMMPDQDGWYLLQALLNQPDTCDIPIIVCSVLKQQKELALSLGATAFLPKPLTEEALISALQALEER